MRNALIAASLTLLLVAAQVWETRAEVPSDTATGADVAARGLADANGSFQSSPPVRRGATYPVLVLASGYQQVEGILQTAPQGANIEVLKPIQLVKQ